MTETTAPTETPLTDPGPPPPAPEGLPTRRDRFFAWVRGLGIQRTGGWLGGVCAGIAARLRVDPLIVRGVFVVASLLGLPMLLAYAIAWALLPDADDRIPLRRRDGFDPALLGALIVFLVGLVPVVPWGFGAFLGSGLVLFNIAGAQVLVALLVLAIVLVLAYLISRLNGRRTSPPEAASRVTAAAAGTAGAPLSSGAGAPALFRPPAEPSAEGSDAALAPPADAPAGASDDEIAAWRAQHEAWRQQETAWRHQQQDAERFAREQAHREQQERAAAFAAESATRRRARRASKPRASAAFVAVVLGAAVVAGAVVLLLQSEASVSPFLAPALGVLTAALVAATGMVVAGVLRRRSGFLAFTSALLLAAGLITAAPTLAQHVWLGDAHLTNRTSDGQTFTHPWGTLYVHLENTGVTTPPIVIDKREGRTHIHVEEGVELELHATLGPDVTVSHQHHTPTGFVTREVERSRQLGMSFFTDENEPTTRHAVHLTQDAGVLRIFTYSSQDPADEESEETR